MIYIRFLYFTFTILSFFTQIIYSNEKYKIHYVQNGETIWKISKKYNIPVNKLCELNSISDVSKVKIGDKLKIPVINDDKNNCNKFDKKYYDYNLPLEGNVKPLVTSNFRGIIIFSDKEYKERIVKAIDKGVVSYLDNINGYGLTLIIRHNNNLISIYSSLAKTNLTIGSKVNKGDNIGIAGPISRYKKNGIIFSIQENGNSLKFDMEKIKFYK